MSIRLSGHGVTLPGHHSLPELYSKRGQNKRGGPVSRVLCRGAPAGAPACTIYLGRPLPAGSCSLPAGWSSTPGRAVHLLLGFAPGEVYRAAAVAGDAVGSYPTFSPSPAGARRSRAPPAVCFLWHSLSASPVGRRGPGVTRRHALMEPGLSSTGAARRGRPAAVHRPASGRRFQSVDASGRLSSIAASSPSSASSLSAGSSSNIRSSSSNSALEASNASPSNSSSPP